MRPQLCALFAILLPIFLLAPYPLPAITFEGGIDTHMHIDGMYSEGGGMNDRR